MDHDLFGVSGQWTGDECSKACYDANGTVCGRVWKECCAEGCQGTFSQTCKHGKEVESDILNCPK